MPVWPCTAAASAREDPKEIIEEVAHEVIVEIFAKGFHIEHKYGDSWKIEISMEDHILHGFDPFFYNVKNSSV